MIGPPSIGTTYVFSTQHRLKDEAEDMNRMVHRGKDVTVLSKTMGIYGDVYKVKGVNSGMVFSAYPTELSVPSTWMAPMGTSASAAGFTSWSWTAPEPAVGEVLPQDERGLSYFEGQRVEIMSTFDLEMDYKGKMRHAYKIKLPGGLIVYVMDEEIAVRVDE